MGWMKRHHPFMSVTRVRWKVSARSGNDSIIRTEVCRELFW